MKKILGLLIALIISTKAFASIAVMPTKIELNANKNKANYISTSIEVRGDKTRPMRFKAYTGYFKINEKGEVLQLEGQTAPNDISKKVKFVPSEFNVQPGKSQRLRINIAGLNSLPDGENRTMLYIEDVNPKEIMLDTGNSGIGAQLIIKTRVGVPVYLDKGKFVKKAELGAFNVTKEKDGTYVAAKVLSTGNSKVRCSSQVQIYKDKKIAQGREAAKSYIKANEDIRDELIKAIKEKKQQQ